MAAAFFAGKAESWVDAIVLRPPGELDGDGVSIPRFVLLETRGPEPWALFLSVVILGGLVSSSIVLGRYSNESRAPRAETVTQLEAPAERRMLPDTFSSKHFRSRSSPLPKAAEPGKVKLPVLQPLKPAPAKVEVITDDLVFEKRRRRALLQEPPLIPIQQERVVALPSVPAMPAVMAAPQPSPVPAFPAPVSAAFTRNPEPPPKIAGAARATAKAVPKAGPASLGGMPLSQLIDEQDGLAAGLAALPSAQRRGLPRVSVRVNAEWLEALPKTHERLYFSITAPEADREVLAYVASSHTFDLERPEQPLWQIHDGERVPALAELRAAAGRWLGVSPTLVGLYTWHPPVFEDALRMFVMERMQALRVHLGPRDVITVRLASGPRGAIMNLEPIREDALP